MNTALLHLLLTGLLLVTSVGLRASVGNILKKAGMTMVVQVVPNPHVWLRENGFKIMGTPSSSGSLIAMLDAGRIDAALMPELAFRHAVQSAGKQLENYSTTSEIKQPFGIYISKKYIRQHPDTMDRINAAIRANAAALPKL